MDSRIIPRFHLKHFQNRTTGCWEWLGYTDKDGYGTFQINRKPYRAHRIAWEIRFGKIPKNKLVLHACDTPCCVNPDHLFLGTQADNIADKMKKQRHKYQIGSNCHSAKLIETDVLAIRKDARKHKIIAQEYGIHPSTVSQIKSRKRWAHL